MHSIRTKITAITIAAILISILAVILASFHTIQAENDRSSAERMNLLSKNTQQSLDDYLDSIEQSVEMAANIAGDTLDSVVLVEGGVAGASARQTEQTPEQAERLDAYLAENCARIQEAFSTVANHTQGVITYYYCIAPEISQSEHGFFYSKAGKTGFEEQPPLDARQFDPNDMEHYTWYYTPIQRGRPSWVGPYSAHFLDEARTVSYLVPIYKAGTLIGVLGMDISFDTLVEQVSPIRIYDTGFACLVDEEGKVLYHPDMQAGSAIDFDGLSVPPEVLRQKDSSGQIIRYSVDGEQRQMAFSTLSSGLKLAIIAPVREINAPWTQLARNILLTTAAILAVFIIVLLITMGIITAPLKRLTAASRKLADGDYDVELPYHSRDEVGVLTGAFSQMRDHLKDYISDLNRKAYTDELTGLSNMRRFFELEGEEKLRMLEAGGHPALLYFNLIGMKHFNRQFGFSEGNALICAVADILRRHYGEAYCSRFGQDHFMVLTDGNGLEEKLHAVFRDCQSANDGRTLPVRVGIYLSRMDPIDTSAACDRAKYACDLNRDSYESHYTYFDDSMIRQLENFRYIINNLDRALKERWIKVCFQPIVRTANGKVCDEEALSRWIDPVKGLVSPGEFIPVLEGARLIYKLDLYVLDQILLKMQHQMQAGLYVVPQSLNLSRVDFDACDIVEEIRRRVDKAGIPREKLTIELTESVVGRDFDFIKEQIGKLQTLGFRVWMDDFGSGYSSLDVLQDIHFDLLKFDMRFMQRFGEGDESKIILTELIKMAISLGVDTVAEGVETSEQVDFLREVGCTKLQGFFFGKAIPMEEILEQSRNGTHIGYENPEETGYYSAIGKINLYDLAAVGSEDGEGLTSYFDMLPMAVVESDEERIRVVRCNRTYHDFMMRFFGGDEFVGEVSFSTLRTGVGSSFVQAVAQCREEGEKVFIDETLPNGGTIHAMARHIAVNPVTGIVACLVVVLGSAGAPD